MTNRPLIWFTVVWLCGNVTSSVYPLFPTAMVAISLLLLLLALAFMRERGFGQAFIFIAAFALAATQRHMVDQSNQTLLPQWMAAAQQDASTSFNVEASGKIDSVVDIDGDQVKFRMQLLRITETEAGQRPLNVKGEQMMVQITLSQRTEQQTALDWHRGQRVRARGTLQLPSSASNFGTFDYRSYLTTQRIHWLLHVEGSEAISVLREPTRFELDYFIAKMDQFRRQLSSRMATLFPAEQAGYMSALVIGVQDDVDPQLFATFSTLGLTHLIAVSGLHVAVFLFLVKHLLQLLRLTREQRLLIMIATVPLYVLFTGGSPSIVRAGIMAIIALMATYRGQLKDGLHILAAAALIMVMWNPLVVHDVGFQLSFLVTAALLLWTKQAEQLFTTRRTKWGQAVQNTLLVTFVAQLASFPISIYYFNQFHLLTFVVNVIFVPLVSFIIMPLAAISLATSYIYFPLGKMLAHLVTLMNDWTLIYTNQLATVQKLHYIFATPSLIWIVSFYSIVALFLFPWQIRFRPRFKNQFHWLRSLLVVGLAVLVLYAYYPQWHNRDGLVQFIDVGQGDAALIRTPTGKHVLIDGGGTLRFGQQEQWRQRRDPYDVGRKLLVPMLRKRGVHQLDYVIISHLDSDHIQGLRAIIASLPVKVIIWNGTLTRTDDAILLMNEIVHRKIPLYRANAGQKLTLDAHTTIKMIYPIQEASPLTSIPIVADQNNHSVGIILQLYRRHFLLCGDIHDESEQLILRQLQAQAAKKVAIDVMKVSHHGSKSSTSEPWLTYWQPTAAVISVGRHNLYHHPHPEVVERLAQHHIKQFQTALRGEIDFLVRPQGSIFVRTAN